MTGELKRYPVRSELLRRYIRFFWTFRAERVRYDHAITPQRVINLKFNLGGTALFSREAAKETRMGDVFFAGLHDQQPSVRIAGAGRADILAVSFLPHGLHPFLGVPMKEFRNRFVDATALGFTAERLGNIPGTPARLAALEEELLRRLQRHGGRAAELPVLFGGPKRIPLPARRLERLFDKYVGVSPAAYALLDRFHSGLKQLLAGGYARLSDIAYDNGYFDQTHYIRDFRRFAGQPPTRFLAQGDSLLQITKIP